MSSTTEIVNSALLKIGAARITSIDDGSKNASAAAYVYDPLRREMLRDHPWNFACLWAKLAQLNNTPAAEFQYFYSLPSDWLRTIQVSDNDSGIGVVGYREQSDGTALRIATSATSVWLRYIQDVTDANVMTADFREALSFVVARDLAVPLANSNTMRQEMSEGYKRALRKARSTDAISDQADKRPLGSWATSRYGWRRPGTTDCF